MENLYPTAVAKNQGYLIYEEAVRKMRKPEYNACSYVVQRKK